MIDSSEYHFFYGGILSNFYPIGPSLTSEKVFMMIKSGVFNDVMSLGKIRESIRPQKSKELGRKISNFDEDVWNIFKVEAMMCALEIKWNISKQFRYKLFDVCDKIIVEASPADRVWGIGYSEDNALNNINNWGENLLGKCLNRLATEKLNVKNPNT